LRFGRGGEKDNKIRGDQGNFKKELDWWGNLKDKVRVLRTGDAR